VLGTLLLFLTFMEPCIANVFLSTTNEMQHFTVFFIVVSALHVLSGFSTHHQELRVVVEGNVAGAVGCLR
jgi:hypothetical protein